MKIKTKKALLIGGSIVAAGIVGTACYVLGHTPKPGIPCSRSTMRADGIPKVAFDKPWKANLRTIVQFVRHGEVCTSYEINGKFYTGHSKKAIIRSIRFLKRA